METEYAAVQTIMDQAKHLQNSGNPAAAVQLYQQVLNSDPRHFEACFLLAALHGRLGRIPDAIAALQKALAVRPNDPIALHACGSLLIETGRFADAITLFDRALASRPGATPFLFNRALALALSGRAAEALCGYDEAVALRPNFTEAWLARGNLLRQLGRFDEALRSFDKALDCDAGNIAAHHSRGLLLADMDRAAEALWHFDKVLELRPDQAGIQLMRGLILRKLGRTGEALQALDAAIAQDGGNAHAWNARGTLLRETRRADDALAAYSQAIAHDPVLVDALVNRGLLQWTQWRRYEEAVADLRYALQLSPSHSYARGELMHIRMYGGDWTDFEKEKQLIDEGVRAGKLSVRPFAYQAISDSPADLGACARTFARLFPTVPSPSHPRHSGGKIRIGYLSADFRDHATAYLMTGLYEAHDRTGFEVIAIDNGKDDGSPTRRRLEAAFDRFVDISRLSDDDAAGCIRAGEIDILVNLNGYYGEYRMGVFARRSSPVQVNYLGFPGTLGAPYMDYLIADRIVIAQDEHRFYDEKIVTLPGCYQANDAARPRPREIPGRAACGLPDGAFVFCNFNQSYKLTPATFAAWMRILSRVPGSVLWLLDQLPALCTNLKQAAVAQGIDPERIIFAPREPVERHLARLARADLVLDSLPYNAHTTASDALWMGVPLVTCRGTSFPGRVAASLLTAAGMSELIAESMTAYESLAVALATDKDRLGSLRSKLSADRRTCTLFDTHGLCRSIETAYRVMHARRLRGEAAVTFNLD